MPTFVFSYYYKDDINITLGIIIGADYEYSIWILANQCEKILIAMGAGSTYSGSIYYCPAPIYIPWFCLVYLCFYGRCFFLWAKNRWETSSLYWKKMQAGHILFDYGFDEVFNQVNICFSLPDRPSQPHHPITQNAFS